MTPTRLMNKNHYLLSNIICDKCNKKIDKYMIYNSFHDESVDIHVFCHGRSSGMKLTKRFLEKNYNKLSPYKAFESTSSPQLNHPSSES